MRAGTAGFEVTDLFRLGRLAHVEDVKTFSIRLAVGAAPARRYAFEAGDHPALGDLDLNRPGIFRPGNKSAKFGRSRVRDVEHAPAAMPEMGDIKIPPAIHFLHGQFERRLAV